MPSGAVVEVTPRCNLACTFCYNPWRCEDGPVPSPLSTGALLEACRRFAGMSGVAFMVFAGGEPLLREDLEDLVRGVGAAAPHARLGVATNGLLLTAGRLASLLDAGVTHLELPLLTTDPAEYQGMTGVDGWVTVRGALSRAAAAPATLTAAILLRPGVPLEDLAELAFALGADRIALNRFTPVGAGALSRDRYLLDRETLDDLLVRADRIAADFGLPVEAALPVEPCLHDHARFPHLGFAPCRCGDAKWAIDPGGNLKVCELADEVLGSLLEEDVKVLMKKAAEFRGRGRFEACGECAVSAMCRGGCRFVES
ncbi:MAG: radical SAM protein [Pseudomonadota bacterium]